MIAAIHQPNFLPWLGFFAKMGRADLFVHADTLAFSKGSYTQRVKIKTHNGLKWLTVPLLHTGRVGDPIVEVRCGGPANWRGRLVDGLRGSYAACPYFKTYFTPIAEILRTCDDHLAEMNLRLIAYIAGELGLQTPTVRASALHQGHLVGRPTEWIIGICKEVGADTFLSGFGGAKYQEEEAYGRNGIRLVYSDFAHPQYRQQFGPFEPGLSSVDLLFNIGPDSRRVLGV